jgi:hypothetical protein
MAGFISSFISKFSSYEKLFVLLDASQARSAASLPRTANPQCSQLVAVMMAVSRFSYVSGR